MTEVASILDLAAFADAPLRRDPCDFVVVPRFLRPEWLAAVNRDYPEIEGPGNFEPGGLRYGPAFAALLEALGSPALKQAMADKFGLDLQDHPLQVTVRRFAEPSDGNVHNDARTKVVTGLIYCNEEWTQPGGRLRLLPSPRSLDDYRAEVLPERGTLLAFRRSETSYHGFLPCEGERRSLQLHYVAAKRARRDAKELTLKRRLKRWWKQRAR